MSRLTIEERNREAELAQQQQANTRLQLEHQSSLQENERRIVENLRQGGETSRQIVAKERVSSLNALSRGRWTPSAEVPVPWGTPVGHAADAINAAAKAAVAEALRPYLEAAEAETAAADEERAAILERGRL